MATVSAPSGTNFAALTGQTAAGSGGAANGQEIAGNFQQFLLLLTTQLKNQSPLDPLDTNQFTQQLVQFASVEQQLKTNATLSTMAAGAKAGLASSAAGLVGATVTADGSSTSFAQGTASWTLNPAKAAASATLTIKDSTGQTVATQIRALPAGSQSFTWDGRTANGGVAAAGAYTLGVVARDAAGQPVTVSTEVSGVVSSVDMSGENPVLLIGTSRVPLAGIKAIGQ
ncbi:flagellar hook capping FlgD N-terminal domain-containing protein [Enterovirga sp.]|jgi:flagellar basal-body rod modification protein FlgD|uniref:flagellar hook assembly protein FlgD n=1 Tax=Enterovirga sp. TaxID=2026350 RepID=UPI00261515FB|nr:flagellar hook capping FlgD N-terminal domain-containing protein [Enterovirga sp.]MDB5591820.1 flagellar hook assembly protein FlgD [Enterovirga sp.]